jgi:hypothetical protein
MKLHQRSYFLWVALVVMFLGACASLQKPVTPEDYLQEAKGQITAAYNTIADLKNGGQITQAQAKSALSQVSKIDDDVHAAEKLMRSGLTVSSTTFQTATAALIVISNTLKANQKGK